MKSKSKKKPNRPETNGSKSRDKVRKMYDESRTAEKAGKSKAPRAERQADTRAGRHKSQAALKQVGDAFNG